MTWQRVAGSRSIIAARVLTAVVVVASSVAAAAQTPSPADDELAISRFEALIKAEKYSEASKDLQQYTTRHPSSWRALYQLGYVNFRLHYVRESVLMLSKSLALNGNFAEAHKILAFDLNILGRQDLAIHELEAATRLDPSSAESFYELGRILYERGSYLQSIEALERAKKLAPDFAKVYHNLGLAYSATGQNAKAVTNFEEALRRNETQKRRSAWPLIDYGTYFNLQGEFTKARDMLLQAIQIDASWDQEFDELSKAYRGLGERDKAIDALQRAITINPRKINPRKAEYHYVLARLYTQAYQSDKAKLELAKYERYRREGANSTPRSPNN